jgi:hypothetical protein
MEGSYWCEFKLDLLTIWFAYSLRGIMVSSLANREN